MRRVVSSLSVGDRYYLGLRRRARGQRFGRSRLGWVFGLMALIALAGCDPGGGLSPGPEPLPPPSTSASPTAEKDLECYSDADCIGAFGDLGDCAVAICSSGGRCMVSNVANDTPCSSATCAFGSCFAGECLPASNMCSLPPDEPAATPPDSEPEPACGDGYCSLDEDCSLCPEDCGACDGDCCSENGSIGCVDPDIVDCVCAYDSYCCDTEWDAECAAKVDELGCGSCAAVPFCGDGICDAGDTCSNCPSDCGTCPAPEPYCGDTVCDAGDTCSNCPADCGTCPPPAPYCGDGYCDGGDTCSNCPADCGTCPPPAPFCGDGLCNGGESCGACPTDCGVCPAPEPSCGDGVCNGDEDCSLCPEDCGVCAGDCCSDNGSIGCVDPSVVDCVCAADPYCCETAWDAECAAKVDELGCGSCTVEAYCGDGYCDFGDTCSNCPSDCGTCPAPEPFCGDGTCDASESCSTCASDCGACPPPEPFCGDGYCDFGDSCSNCPADCGTCPAPEPYCGDGICDGGDTCGNCASDCGLCAASCCEEHGGVGCDDPDVMNTVCDIDPYCCDTAWDADCIALAESDAGLSCSSEAVCGDGFCAFNEDGSWCPEDCGELAQDCCSDVGGVSCSDDFIAQCVCDADAYCCETAWDATCAELVDELGCGYCAVPPAG